MNKKIGALFSVALAMASCQLANASGYPGEQEVNSLTKGMKGGCALGAKQGETANTGKSGAFGCIALHSNSGIYQAQLDEQERALRSELLNTGILIHRENGVIKLVMNSDTAFKSGDDSLSHTIKPALRGIARVLKKYDHSVVTITGHTDSSGELLINQSLSENRAASVTAYIKSYGINSERIDAQGLGETSHRCSNETTEGRKCNRRVEVQVSP